MSYDPVSIVNSTGHNIPKGEVTYPSFLCSDDRYDISIGGTWHARSRGACLVTRITATVDVRGKYIEAAPYTSTGTSYSSFAVVATGPESFAVTRLVTSGDNVDLGTVLPEPTEQQK